MIEAGWVVEEAINWKLGMSVIGQSVSDIDAVSHVMRTQFGSDVIKKAVGAIDPGVTIMHINERLQNLTREGHSQFSEGLTSVFMGIAGLHLRQRAADPSMDILPYVAEVGNSFTGTPLPSIDTAAYRTKAVEDGITSFNPREYQAKLLKQTLDQNGNLKPLYTDPSQFDRLDLAHFIKYYLSETTYLILMPHLIEKGGLFEDCIGLMGGAAPESKEDQIKAEWEKIRIKFANSPDDRLPQ